MRMREVLEKSLLAMMLSFPCLPLSAGQERPFVQKGSIGVPLPKDSNHSKNESGFRPVTDWLGQKFIFLPQSKDLQKYGYQEVETEHGHVPYDEAVGRIGTVTEVKKLSSDAIASWLIRIRMDDNGQMYSALAVPDDPDDAAVDGLAPLHDLQEARTKWLGKNLWIKRNKTIGTYDESSGKVGDIEIPNCSHVVVENVIAGWDHSDPVRFVVRTDSGAEGFVDVNISGTNVSKVLREITSFDENFFDSDPREAFKWPPHVWDAVAGRKVFVGMTTDQARMSWGNPKDINRTVSSKNIDEQWVYISGSYLYFENGILTSIQN